MAKASNNLDGLVKAARMLLAEEVSDEEIIIPTLAFVASSVFRANPAAGWEELLRQGWYGDIGKINESAAEIYQNAGLLGAELTWDVLCGAFSDYFLSTPVKIVDETVILKRECLTIASIYDHPSADTPQQIQITVLQGARTPKPKEVSRTYRDYLSEIGMPYDRGESLFTRTEHCITDGLLAIAFFPSSDRLTKEEKRVFPSPTWVERYYESLMKLKAFKVVKGKTGPSPKAKNVIVPCIAHILREHTELKPKEINTLLNERVLPEGQIPLEVGYSGSRSSQLSSNEKNVALRLRHAYRDFSNPNWSWESFLAPYNR